MGMRGQGDICAFCRMPPPTSEEEEIERTKKLMKSGSGDAFNQLANYYDEGIVGMPQDRRKANELYLKAGELGCAEGYYNLAVFYKYGMGVAVNEKKAIYYWELAAMSGCVEARQVLVVKKVRLAIITVQ